MTTILEFAIIAIPLTAVVAAMLCFGRKHIHRQMDEIAEAAKSGAFKRPVRFHPLPAHPEKHRSPVGNPKPSATARAA